MVEERKTEPGWVYSMGTHNEGESRLKMEAHGFFPAQNHKCWWHLGGRGALTQPPERWQHWRVWGGCKKPVWSLTVSCDFSAGSAVGLRSHVGQKGWENLLESADDLASAPLALWDLKEKFLCNEDSRPTVQAVSKVPALSFLREPRPDKTCLTKLKEARSA